MPFIIRRKLYPEENLNLSSPPASVVPDPVPEPPTVPAPDAIPDPTLVITEIIQPAAPEPVVLEPVMVSVPEPVMVSAPEPVMVSAPEPVVPEPVMVSAPEPVVVPEPVMAPSPVTQTPVSVFSHPSMAEKKQKFLAFLAKRR